MDNPSVPEDLRRFVLTSIPSVPYLEAVLLMRADPAQPWVRESLARRLYVSERVAEGLLADLCAAGVAKRSADAQGRTSYHYAPADEALAARIDLLATLYARHLVEITHLIHSSIERKARQFADAFKWRKDS